MIYDTSNPLQRSKLLERCKQLAESGKAVELTLKRNKRSTQQNSYLHVCLSAFAIEFGFTLQQVKDDVFKRHVCKDLFVSANGGFEVCKSTTELDTKQMTDAIDKFRDWSAIEMNFYIPDPDDLAFEQMREWVDENQKYL